MKKKGFTLIELLAVIVILAIIALITVPVVINIINNAKKGSAEDSTYGVIESAKLFWITNQSGFTDTNSNILFTCNSNGTCTTTLSGSSATTLDISGTKPTGGTIRIENDGVTVTDLKFGDYYCSKAKTEEKVNCGTSSSTNNNEQNNNEQQEPTYTVYTPGQLVYFDPTSDSTTCSSENPSENAETCYKWRIITLDDNNLNENITLQMDHNLVNEDAWVSKLDYNDDTNFGSDGNNNKGPITALKSLATATSSWENVDNLTYSYNTSAAESNYGTLSCNDGDCTINGVALTTTNNEKIKARMITVEEIKAITLNKMNELNMTTSGTLANDWSLASSISGYFYFSKTSINLGTQTSGTENASIELAWLVENTTANDTSSSSNNTYWDNNSGYWTLSPVSDYSSSAWSMYNYGYLNPDYVNYDSPYGIRPVITIAKSKIK